MTVPSYIPKHVRVVEVGPRDGLQNESKVMLSAQFKANLIDKLANAGIRHIEAAAFVNPKWVPQMANSTEVMKLITRHRHVSYSALTPNLQGLEQALDVGIDEVAFFTTASETFSLRNTNCSIAESIARLAPLAAKAQTAGVKVRGYISMVVDCPYEGSIMAQKVAEIADTLMQMGCYQIALGDTVGSATPGRIHNLLATISQYVPPRLLAGHCHNTYGQALANVYAMLQAGVTCFDSSVAGLGGCPYAKGASGNLASEDLVYMLEGLGIDTGIQLDRLIRIGQDISASLQRSNGSQVGLTS